MLKSTCGIAAMGFYLPEKEIPLLELAKKAGIPAFVADYAGARTVREAATDEFPSHMAIKAAETALKNGNIDTGRWSSIWGRDAPACSLACRLRKPRLPSMKDIIP